MIGRPELHPDDPANRLRLRDQLQQMRAQRRLTRVALSQRMGGTDVTVRDLERDTSWSVKRVQAWARGLDHQFRLSITGIEVPDTYDLRADLLAMAEPASPADADRLHLLTVVNDLVRIREHQGLNCERLAGRMGVNSRAVRGWEDEPENTLVKMVQRYCRAVGGVLTLDLVPVAVAVA